MQYVLKLRVCFCLLHCRADGYLDMRLIHRLVVSVYSVHRFHPSNQIKILENKLASLYASEIICNCKVRACSHTKPESKMFMFLKALVETMALKKLESCDIERDWKF